MGLHVFVTGETLEGFPVTDVYCRIVSFTYTPRGGDCVHLCIRVEYHLTRDLRLAARLPVRVAALPDTWVYECPIETLPQLYARIADSLQTNGFTVENVLEPLPEPSPTGPTGDAMAEPSPTGPTGSPAE